jgi:hypothetical protein
MVYPPTPVVLWILEDPHAPRSKFLAGSIPDDKGGAEAANLDAATAASATAASATADHCGRRFKERRD